jgi:hypothetical protein
MRCARALLDFASLREDEHWEPALRVNITNWRWNGFSNSCRLGQRWHWRVRGTGTGWYESWKTGLGPRLAHALEAKKRMPGRHKTDQLYAKGLAIMLRNGSLPEVWIPPAHLLNLRSSFLKIREPDIWSAFGR